MSVRDPFGVFRDPFAVHSASVCIPNSLSKLHRRAAARKRINAGILSSSRSDIYQTHLSGVYYESNDVPLAFLDGMMT